MRGETITLQVRGVLAVFVCVMFLIGGIVPQLFAAEDLNSKTDAKKLINKLSPELKTQLKEAKKETRLNILVKKSEKDKKLFNALLGKKTKDIILNSRGKIKRETSDYISVDISAEDFANMLSDDMIEKVYTDSIYSATLDNSVKLIKTDYAWNLGYKGEGVKIAALDTGIDFNNPAFNNRVISSAVFTGEDSAIDKQGHGTQVASIIAGNGEYKGVAPEALLLNAKVLDNFGNGYVSSIISGIEWAISNNADIISMSLGKPGDLEVPLNEAIQKAIDAGIVVVVASGNCGQGCNGVVGVTAPGNYKEVITVGAVNDNLEHPLFSSGQNFENYIKPDVSAPGVGIISDSINSQIKSMTGTSAATPHIAGVAALLLEKDPTLNHYSIKSLL